MARTVGRHGAHARKSEAPGEALVDDHALLDECGRLVEPETVTGDVDASTTKHELDRIQALQSVPRPAPLTIAPPPLKPAQTQFDLGL